MEMRSEMVAFLFFIVIFIIIIKYKHTNLYEENC